jgi:hypothetical protein
LLALLLADQLADQRRFLPREPSEPTHRLKDLLLIDNLLIGVLRNF